MSRAETQTAPSPAEMSPPPPGTPTLIVATTFLVKGSILLTVPLPWFSVHTKPSPTAMKRGAVSTGISVALPAESAGLIWPRSGLAAKHGIDTLAGVIDADYRGEIRVVLINHGPADYTIRKGDRIAQMLIQKIEFIDVVESDSLPDSVRGVGGFGSSGR